MQLVQWPVGPRGGGICLSAAAAYVLVLKIAGSGGFRVFFQGVHRSRPQDGSSSNLSGRAIFSVCAQ